MVTLLLSLVNPSGARCWCHVEGACGPPALPRASMATSYNPWNRDTALWMARWVLLCPSLVPPSPADATAPHIRCHLLAAPLRCPFLNILSLEDPCSRRGQETKAATGEVQARVSLLALRVSRLFKEQLFSSTQPW